MSRPNFTVTREGTIFLVTPASDAMFDVLATRVGDESTWFARSLVVEQHYIKDFVDGLRDDGYTVRT